MCEIILCDAIVEKLDNNDYSVLSIENQGGKFIADLETYSPEGEDVVITVFFDGTDDDFVRAFAKMADDFDEEEHAEMWIECRGKNGTPDSILDLINDAKAIKEDLLRMAAILQGRNTEENQAESVYNALDAIYCNIKSEQKNGAELDRILQAAMDAVSELMES